MKDEKVKEKKDELEILIGEERKYKVGGKEFTQKPLVLRNFQKLFKILVNIASALVEADPGLEIDIGTMSPDSFIRLASASDKAFDGFYDIVALILKTDKQFLLDNMTPSIFTEVLSDVFELNKLGDIIKNFQKIGLQVKKELKSLNSLGG